MSNKKREIYKDLDISNWKVYKGQDLTNNEYHGEKEHSSSSNLKDLIKVKQGRFDKELWGREKYYQEKILGNRGEQKSSNAFDEGSLAHNMILEPEMFDTDFSIYSGFRKAGNDFKAFKAAEEAGLNRTILSKAQYKRVESWVAAYRLNPTAVEMIAKCETEYSLFGEIDGVKIKVRADAIDVENGIIADVKTSGKAIDLENWKYTVEDFEYQLSGALYARLFSMYYGKPFRFYFICLGKQDKDCEIYRLGDEKHREGDLQVNKALKVYKECKESGLWINPKKEEAKKVVKTYDNYTILDC